MKRDHWIVGDHGIRPSGKPDQCFYCGQPRGNEHLAKCCLRRRTVVVEVTITLIRSVPEFWGEGLIEDRGLTIGCGSNLVDEIADFANRRESAGQCLCDSIILQRFIREATEQDEAGALLFVADMPE